MVKVSQARFEDETVEGVMDHIRAFIEMHPSGYIRFCRCAGSGDVLINTVAREVDYELDLEIQMYSPAMPYTPKRPQ